ncbi:hypothetical protein TNCV_3171411 [Trichonephila clavipes]|nr:hypothetical protein TNCV_3171411 [Trichonephila clavipes]
MLFSSELLTSLISPLSEEQKKRDRKEETFLSLSPNLLRPDESHPKCGRDYYPTLILFISSPRWFGRRPKQSKEFSEMDIYILGNRTLLRFSEVQCPAVNQCWLNINT